MKLFNFKRSIALLFILTSFATCVFWKHQFDDIDDDTMISDEQIEKLLGINIQSSYPFEEYLTKIAMASPFHFDKLAEPTNDCAERRDYSGPDFMQFLPQTKAILKSVNDVIEFKNDCFMKNTASFTIEPNGQVIVNIVASDPYSLLCKDTYVLTTSKHYETKINFMKGEHLITFKGLDADDMIDIAVNGIRIFGFCEGLTETVISVYKTFKFLKKSAINDDHVETLQRKMPLYKDETPEEMEIKHTDFLKKFSNMIVEDRGKYGEMVLPIEDSIQSGDFLGLTQMDSVMSVMIMYVSGGMISHAAIALRLENNELYVSEMKGSGLKISTYKEFIEEQIRTRHYIVHCPLKEEYRKKFNTEAAYAYHKSLGPMNYGDYNFLFSAIDVSKDAFANYIPTENLYLMFFMIEKFDYEYVSDMIGTGLNMRLGTKNLTLSQLAIEGAKRNMTFEELVAVPEDDSWLYDNGENIICSGYVAKMYKIGGILDHIDFNTKEFQPRDLILLNIFDLNYKETRPQICKDADPELPYCQIMGTYRLHFKDYSTLAPYDHMFDHCPCKAPDYILTPGC